MTLQETAKELNKLVKTDKEIKLEDRVEKLEKIIENLCDRIDYLEKHI